jgi:hypothetical protein
MDEFASIGQFFSFHCSPRHPKRKSLQIGKHPQNHWSDLLHDLPILPDAGGGMMKYRRAPGTFPSPVPSKAPLHSAINSAIGAASA